MSEPDRPNPDALLAALQRDEAKQRRGRLKVFLGMSAGVGKTYAMLEAARRELANGRDVVVGYVETHGRKETDALAAGLPTVPRLQVEHRGVALTEMDLDAVLARKPQLALVDELAHSNAPGSRHPKRYQDVLELLDSGIDVFTTINVQHIESRSEAVSQITTVIIHETVPDTVLDGTEIELVDLPPEELLTRLREGKVYFAERATAAASNFFKVGNLIALRELALRLTAEHVGHEVRDYLQSRQITGPWKTGARLMVAIGPSPLSASLVRWTRRLADSLHATWLAVYVETPTPLIEAQQKRLEQNLALARQLGAEVITTPDQDLVSGLLHAARTQNVTEIIFGKPGGRWLDSWRGRETLRRLVGESGDIDVLVVRADKGEASAPAYVWPRIATIPWQQYTAALATFAGVTLLCLAMQSWIGYQAVALVYLLSVVILALFVGRGPIIFCATLTALGWDYLFIEPLYTFRITEFHDKMMLAMFFVVSLTVGQLTARLRAQRSAEHQREARASALYLLTRELAEAADLVDILGRIVRQVSTVFNAEVAMFLPDPDDNNRLTPYAAGNWFLSDKEEGVAAWAYGHNQPAGHGTDTLPQAEGLHLPLSAGGPPTGVLALRFKSQSVLTLQQRNLLESFIRQIALVLDRQRLRDVEINNKLLSESERLGRTLLNSVSHELRTPIAAISSAVSGLRESGSLSPAQQNLALEIDSAGTRLNRLVQSLLSAARLQAGQVRPKLDWCDVTDLVQVALRSVEELLAGHPLETRVPSGLPLVKLDFVLMEQALANLLANAAFHTPPGTRVELSVRLEAQDLIIEIADHGPGLPPNELDRIFDLFHRAPSAKPGGTGLGLAIVKGFVEAQGGKVSAAQRPGGGALFSIRLPVPDAPSLPEEPV